MGGLRELKKERTRAAILGAARRLVGRDGFAATTMAAVAAEAEVAAGTLYNYFPSKDDLLLGLWDDATRAALDEVDARLHAAGADAEAQCAALLILYAETGRTFARPVMRDVLACTFASVSDKHIELDRRLMEELGSRLECWRGAGQLAAGVEAEAAMGLLYGIATTQLMAYVYVPDLAFEDVEAGIRAQVAIVFAGLGARGVSGGNQAGHSKQEKKR